MERIASGRGLNPGDVLMVARNMRDKRGKSYVWRRFFFVVSRPRRHIVAGYIIGNDKLKDEEVTLRFAAENTTHLLDQAEWPDGVHAYRMSMILRGLIDGVADL